MPSVTQCHRTLLSHIILSDHHWMHCHVTLFVYTRPGHALCVTLTNIVCGVFGGLGLLTWRCVVYRSVRIIVSNTCHVWHTCYVWYVFTSIIVVLVIMTVSMISNITVDVYIYIYIHMYVCIYLYVYMYIVAHRTCHVIWRHTYYILHVTCTMCYSIYTYYPTYHIPYRSYHVPCFDMALNVARIICWCRSMRYDHDATTSSFTSTCCTIYFVVYYWTRLLSRWWLIYSQTEYYPEKHATEDNLSERHAASNRGVDISFGCRGRMWPYPCHFSPVIILSCLSCHFIGRCPPQGDRKVSERMWDLQGKDVALSVPLLA